MWPETSRNQLGDAVASLSGTRESLLHYLMLTLNQRIALFSDGWIFFFKKLILLHSTVERAETMSLSPLLLLVIGQVAGGIMTMRVNWLHYGMSAWNQHSQQAPGRGTACSDITCFPFWPFPSSVNILLRWALIIINPYSIWQHFSYSQNIPETVSPLHLFQSSLCITALIVDFPGKDSNELPPFLTASVNTVMCQNSIWEHSSDQ